jgi:hypothetical protein
LDVHGSCSSFWDAPFALVSLTQIATKPILNPKIGEPIMESLKEGVKFVFNNKTILGALSLDMIAVLLVELLHYCQFCTGYFESRPTGIWCFESRPAVGAFDADYLRYIPFTKNAGMKLLAAILGLNFHCF